MDRVITIELAIFGFGWYATFAFFKRFAPYPTQFLKIKEEDERNKKFDFYLTHWVSLVHALLLIILGTWATIIYPFEYNRNIYPFEVFIVKISLSYFIYDSILGYFKGYNTLIMNAHHIIACSTLIYPLYSYFNLKAILTL